MNAVYGVLRDKPLFLPEGGHTLKQPPHMRRLQRITGGLRCRKPAGCRLLRGVLPCRKSGQRVTMFYELIPAHAVCAHRGARSLAPENTMLAAHKALACGAHCWELDVQRSRDGVPVVFHDHDLSRTTDAARLFSHGGSAPVLQTALHDFAQLRSLDAGSWFGRKDPFGTVASGEVTRGALAAMEGQPVPSLAEALRFTREHSFPVNIEIKEQVHSPGDMRIITEVLDIIQAEDCAGLVLLSSFSHEYLREVRRQWPEVPLALLSEGATPEETHPADGTASGIAGYLRGIGAQSYHPDHTVTDAGLVRELAALGITVNVWTVNDAAAARGFHDAGARCIITDMPQRLVPDGRG
jgi:glycerophosphoryl diester phosphodiesterase